KGNRIFEIAAYCKNSHSCRVIRTICATRRSTCGYDFDGQYFYVGGINILKSRKYKNVLKNNKVALVIDDLKTIDPWDPRGIRIYGTADIVTRQSGYMEQTAHPQADYIRIKPEKKWSWGIHEPVFLSTN